MQTYESFKNSTEWPQSISHCYKHDIYIEQESGRIFIHPTNLKCSPMYAIEIKSTKYYLQSEFSKNSLNENLQNQNASQLFGFRLKQQKIFSIRLKIKS